MKDYQHNRYDKLDFSDEKIGVCGWIGVGIMAAIFFFLFGFLIYEFATWKEDRINEWT